MVSATFLRFMLHISQTTATRNMNDIMEVIPIPRTKSTKSTAPLNPDPVSVGTDIVKTEQSKPKRRGGNHHPIQSRAGLIQTEEDRQFVSTLLHEVLIEYKQTKVRSDEELQNRLNDYFQRCADTGQIPTVEELCMSTGYSGAMIWDIEAGRKKGFSSETADIIKKAKEFIKTFDAKLVVTGKMNFLAYCFRAKNYYGMSDKNEYVITPNTQSESDYSAEDIARRYGTDSGNVIETTFEE